MKLLAPFIPLLVVSPFVDLVAAQESPELADAVALDRAVLEGRVLAEDGLPAVGAVVFSSAGGHAVTESNGTILLEVELPPGARTVQVSAVANGSSSGQVATKQVSGLVRGGTTRVDTLHLLQSGGCQPKWLPTFGGEPGTNGDVSALAVFDDGSGGGPVLYAGGEFTSAGGVYASYVAKWDGTSWSPLEDGVPGLDGPVSALMVFDDGSGPALYAGGRFLSAGAVPLNRIAKWDGSTWSPLGGGVGGSVTTMAAFDDGGAGGPALYAAGAFTSAGGAVGFNRIAKWDGSSWSALGTGMNDRISALTVFDDGSSGPALFAAGDFLQAGGASAQKVAKWDGSTWSALGSGTTGAAKALAVFDDGQGPALYVGGHFPLAGGVPVNGIAKWDGSSWSALGSGMSRFVPGGFGVFALTVFDDGNGGGPGLFAAGWFAQAGGVAAKAVAKWDGSSWSALANGSNSYVTALTVHDDGSGSGPALYAGGWFTTMNSTLPVKRVARWDGSDWSALGGAQSHDVHSLAVFDDASGTGPALYAGFRIKNSGASDFVAKWNGSNWTALGGGLSSAYSVSSLLVTALAVFDDGGGGGPALYVGGNFTKAGGQPAIGVAKWDGTSWSAVGSGISNQSLVRAFAVFDDGSGAGPSLYAGGNFITAGGIQVNYVAKWDGTNWSALGSGVSNDVNALAVFDDGAGGGPALYAGGGFSSAGGVAAGRIAKWDGSSWSPLGSGIGPGTIRALAVFDDGGGAGPALYAGGYFTSAGGSPTNHVAKWDGTSWSSLGSGIISSYLSGVRALTVFDDGSGAGDALFVGGDFDTAGGLPVNYIAKWDGSSWSALGSGMNSGYIPFSGLAAGVGALTCFDDGSGPALIAGGAFTASAAGDSRIAKWGCPAPTSFTTFCTAKTTLFCGAALASATGTSSSTATSGFVIQAQPVRGCRAGLLLYSNQPTQPGVSFGGPGNGMLCVAPGGLRRAGPIESGGGQQTCDGVMSIDMNAFNTNNWTASGCNPAAPQTAPAGFLSNMGTTVNAQVWGRDSIATGQVVSDGIAWSIGP